MTKYLAATLLVVSISVNAQVTNWQNNPLNWNNSDLNYKNSSYEWKNSQYNWNNSNLNYNQINGVYNNSGYEIGYKNKSLDETTNYFDSDGNRTAYSIDR